MTHNLSSEDLAYIAGIFDGEGCIRLSVNKNGPQITVYISNNNLELLEWLKTTIGAGSIQLSRKAEPEKNHKANYRYTIASKLAVSLCKLIRPFLIVKASQVDVILAYAAQEETAGARQGFKVSKARIEARELVRAKLSALKLVS